MKILLCGLLLLVCSVAPAYALPTDAIGYVRSLKGQVTITRGTQMLPGAAGMALYRGDVIRTGKPGAAGIVLTDDTTISLGPASALSLQKYAFDPKGGKFSLVLRMMKGTFAYISGLIAKLSPESVQLHIPDATIAVRGTKLLIEIQE